VGGHRLRRERYKKRNTVERAINKRPAFGYQYFGEVDIDGSSKVMTVRLRDIDGKVLYSVAIDPQR
jgi:alkaline phosphatase D